MPAATFGRPESRRRSRARSRARSIPDRAPSRCRAHAAQTKISSRHQSARSTRNMTFFERRIPWEF